MATIITEENNPALWQSLYDMWIAEKKPGWVVNSKITYTVIQNVQSKIEFHETSRESMYESTSFR